MKKISEVMRLGLALYPNIRKTKGSLFSSAKHFPPSGVCALGLCYLGTGHTRELEIGTRRLLRDFCQAEPITAVKNHIICDYILDNADLSFGEKGFIREMMEFAPDSDDYIISLLVNLNDCTSATFEQIIAALEHAGL